MQPQFRANHFQIHQSAPDRHDGHQVGHSPRGARGGISIGLNDPVISGPKMMSKLPYKLLAVQLGLGLLDRDHLVDLDRTLQPQFGHNIGSQVPQSAFDKPEPEEHHVTRRM